MSTETATLILFMINAIQYFYIISAFFERTIKNFWIGAFIYAFAGISMRIISSLFDGWVYLIVSFVAIVMHVVILYPLFRFKKWHYACIIEFVVMITLILIQMPAIWLTEPITGQNVVTEINGGDFNLSYVIATSLSCMMYMIFIFIVYVIKFVIKYSCSKKLLLSTFMITIYQLIVISLFYVLCRDNNDVAILGGVIFVVFSILSDMAILISIENSLKKIQMEKIWNQLAIQRRKEYETYCNIQKYIEQMRMERHDYVNFIQTIGQMISVPSLYGEAKMIISKLQKMRNGKGTKDEKN